MLPERPYLRGNSPAGKSSVVLWLVSILLGGFLIQLALGNAGRGTPDAIEASLGLRADDLGSGIAWRFVTFGWVHSSANLLHLAGVIVGLVFTGRTLLPLLSPVRFALLFGTANLIGGLVWLGMRHDTGEILVGSTAGVFGLLALVASIDPIREYRVLVFFAFPVTIRPRQLLTSLLAVDLAAIVIVDLLGRELPFAFAAPAHAAGALVGWSYYRFAHDRGSTAREIPAEERLPEAALVPTGPMQAADTRRAPARPVSAAELRARVDVVLDKINAHGIASLTPAERRLLDEARNRLGHLR